MQKSSIDVTWQNGMAFKTEINGHPLMLDAHSSVGGDDKGPPPKPLMLVALGGCTGMDVISILGKMRVQVDGFNVKVEAEMTEDHPRRYTKMHIIYEFKGNDLPLAKLEKAVSLSEERYCGVSAVYKKGMEVTSEIKIL